MRRHNSRMMNSDEKDVKKMIYVTVGVFLVAFIAFVITFVTYSNILDKDVKVSDNKSKITDLDSSQVSSSMGKTVNEIQENTIHNDEETSTNIEKIAINTSNMEKEEAKVDTSKTSSNTVTDKEIIKKKEMSFIKPVEGEIIKEFAKDKLVYSQTLQEWVTHTGIDIKADKTTVVKSTEEGTVKSIKNDPRYGITVIIEHDDGFKTIYSNLLTAEFVKEGEKVKQGQTIGTVGNTAMFEISDESHLHFEMLKDNENIDPLLYIK